MIRIVIARSVVDLLQNLPIAREDSDTGRPSSRGGHPQDPVRTYRLSNRCSAAIGPGDSAPALLHAASDLGRVRDDDVLDRRLRRLLQLHPEIDSEHMAEVFAVLREQRLHDRMSLIVRLDETATTRAC